MGTREHIEPIWDMHRPYVIQKMGHTQEIYGTKYENKLNICGKTCRTQRVNHEEPGKKTQILGTY
jgi:hypothetical protein